MPPSQRVREWSAALLPVVAVAAVGWWANGAVERVVRDRVASRLDAMLASAETGLRAVAGQQQTLVRWIASEPRVRRELVAVLRRAPADTAALDRILAPVLGSHGVENFAVIAPDGRILASSDRALVGLVTARYGPDAVARLADGGAVTMPPFAVTDPDGRVHPAVLTATGIVEGGRLLGWFDVRVDPTIDFGPLIASSRDGATGEVLVVDTAGLLLSRSRFEPELRRVRLLGPDTTATSALALRLADPGGDLLAGHAPGGTPGTWPLTRGAALAAAGDSGHDVRGYRSYLGREVVGAWRWYPASGIALLAEQSVSEAYAPAQLLRRAFVALLGLLLLGAVAVTAGQRLLHRERRRADRAERLGQYTLERLVGEGAMGTVYRASHALLRRPTAIKLLRETRRTSRGVGRFEREAQITSRLTHPNTVAVYDYGRSDAGRLYIAMEFLEGLTVDQMVKLDGPLPERRVVHLLKQVAGSLAEAHALDLVHRDVKPQNIMVCHRGGVPDFVKVLDFGLAKEGDESGDPRLTTDGATVGTPLYMAPEAASASMDVDVRADLYSLGVVAYFMLTGLHPFHGVSAQEVFRKHLEERPRPPSEQLARPVTPELEALVLRCLAKERGMRPPSAHAFLAMLVDVIEPRIGPWTDEEADAWWRARAPHLVTVGGDLSASDAGALCVDLAERLPT